MTIPNRQPRSDPAQLIAYLVRDTAILDGHATHVALFYLPELGPILSCSSVVSVENNSGHMATLAENRRCAYPGCADYTLQVHVHVAIAVHEGAVVCVAILELQQLRPQRHTTQGRLVREHTARQGTRTAKGSCTYNWIVYCSTEQ